MTKSQQSGAQVVSGIVLEIALQSCCSDTDAVVQLKLTMAHVRQP